MEFLPEARDRQTADAIAKNSNERESAKEPRSFVLITIQRTRLADFLLSNFGRSFEVLNFSDPNLRNLNPAWIFLKSLFSDSFGTL
jgi:hypothetical protein